MAGGSRPGILFVSPWLRDGGLEASLLSKVDWLVRRGYPVEVLTWVIGDPPNLFLEFARTRGVPVRRLHGWGRLQLAQRAAQVAARALHGGFRIVVGEELEGNLVALAAGALLAGSRRVVAEVHSASLMFAETAVAPGLLRMARRLYPRANGIVAVSETLRDDLARFFGLDADRITAVYNPTPLDRIRRLAREAAPVAEQIGPFIVGCGRLVSYKCFPDLVRAFALARSRAPLKLVILGEGPERPLLARVAVESGVANDVLLPGFVTNPYPYFARAQAFVLPSRSEGQSLVLVEAMACGVPVIATRSGGPEDVLGHGSYGLLCRVGDVQELAAAIGRVLESPAERHRLVTAAARRVEDFADDRILPRLEALYLGAEPPT
ncbi:MAG: glycosyl transferase [Acidobacteria bacterium]|nr:MAG: glycosyl transferase [Acidobacteriota bacterium]